MYMYAMRERGREREGEGEGEREHYNITSLVTCLVTHQRLCNRLVTSLQALLL